MVCVALRNAHYLVDIDLLVPIQKRPTQSYQEVETASDLFVLVEAVFRCQGHLQHLFFQ
jgi:hypothetical protein